MTDSYSYVANAASGNTSALDQVTLRVGGARDYTFGAAGHLEEVAAGANVVDFTSDGEGRLNQVSRTAGSTSPFTYDGRSFLTEAGDLATVGVTRPVYSSEGQVMALRQQPSAAEPELVATILYFAGRPVAQIEIGGPETRWWYFTTDHLGTSQVATDETGDELWAARLEPFGEDSLRGTPDGALENGIFLRLPGQWETDTWQDAAFGADVFYNVHRWYTPGTGSYTRPDPLGQSGDPHPFAYASSRPTVLIDPLGLVSWRCKGVEVSAGAVGAGTVAFAECDSGCINGKRVIANYALGGAGFGADVAFPFEVGFWDLEDGEARPMASSLEGGFAARGCSVTILIGFSVTQVTQGKGEGEFSFSPSFGLGLGCFGVTGASKLVDVQEACCFEGPTIRNR